METGATTHEVPVDACTGSRGDAHTATSLPAASPDARRRSETEVSGSDITFVVDRTAETDSSSSDTTHSSQLELAGSDVRAWEREPLNSDASMTPSWDSLPASCDDVMDGRRDNKAALDTSESSLSDVIVIDGGGVSQQWELSAVDQTQKEAGRGRHENTTSTMIQCAGLESAGHGSVQVQSSLQAWSVLPPDDTPRTSSGATTVSINSSGQRCLKNTSCAQRKVEKMHEVQVFFAVGSSGVTPEKHSPSQTLLGWQESSKTEDRERPSCSTHTAETVAGISSFSQVRTVLASVSKRPQCNRDQTNSLPYAAEDSCGGTLLSGRGGEDGAEEVTPLLGQPRLCIQNSESRTEGMFEGNAAYNLSTFNNTPVAMGTVNSQQQQSQHSWSGIRPLDNALFPSQNPPHQASSSQNQECRSAQCQQPSLPYSCTFCSRRYAHQCQLRIHERVHTGEKPYQCVQCGKRFGQVCSLKRHQMVHTGEKPFSCPHCGKQFSTSTNLKVHQSVHTGEKRFHCSKCGKNFSFLSNLIRHQALHTAK
ncbi:hypothetical protein FQN60_011548 [Etheostoma spectabile]|uniref:C2H2-type domain-containing protein n=1 Tax=Etheostoma spectabile TaxID=54343 RepID=A0A5J5DMF5_9PERO|nr:hypothetical protein FQN60_011548 [Etheostoma spectabile]